MQNTAKYPSTYLDNLNISLASFNILLANTKASHWLVTGNSFFDLHSKFESLYSTIAEIVDDLAERILALGFIPETKYSVYLQLSTVKENPPTRDEVEIVNMCITNLNSLNKICVEICEMAEKENDKATEDKFISYIQTIEKELWMFSAFLNS